MTVQPPASGSFFRNSTSCRHAASVYFLPSLKPTPQTVTTGLPR
jgi:hypothetical protein